MQYYKLAGEFFVGDILLDHDGRQIATKRKGTHV
jgi:hypothetical protein